MDSSTTVLSCWPIWCSLRLVRGLTDRARLLLLVSVVLSGCQLRTSGVSKLHGFYLNPDRDLSVVGRVALVEMSSDSSHPQISTDVTEALFLALQKKQIFGLTVVSRQDPSWRSLQMDRQSHYNLEQLLATRKALKCDAILIGTITEYQPYPHLAIGLRMKLIDLKDGDLLWGLEQVWDAADKATERRIRSYLQREMRSDSAALSQQLVAVSSLKFVKFVAYEVAETLQPRR